MKEPKRGTSTSSFGVSRRENHDATDFYSRFTVPEISDDATIGRTEATDVIHLGSSTHMPQVADNSVALVVTSPPYFAGKDYETDLGKGHIPKDYVRYLEMLSEVFEECARKLEPGGRIAVNVANLGRKPYRSLASDVVHILQDRLGLLLRGEIVWQKARGAGGSCAWGSFQSAANPVLRDITERVIVASKGRFDRALGPKHRQKQELPSEMTISRELFMEGTLDLWDIAPESAVRVDHPAPFPVELPARLMQLYTYKGDLVLDPFMGSGSTAVAAVRQERHFVGFDTEPKYVEAATQRVELERKKLETEKPTRLRVSLPAIPGPAPEDEDPQKRAVREGRRAREIAKVLLESAGFEIIQEERKFPSGVEMNFVCEDRKGREWYFDISGAFTSSRAGLLRTDTLWKALGKAGVLKSVKKGAPVVLLTTNLPRKGSAGWHALVSARKHLFHDALEMLNPASLERLTRYADGEGYELPLDDLLPPSDYFIE